jgi:G3E family GTPase
VLESVTAQALRSRGHVWLASQPDLAIACVSGRFYGRQTHTWESAGGGLDMGCLGRWLAALPDDRWQEASDQRRLAAAVDWDPYYGDRHNHLVFVGLNLDPADLHNQLAAGLLTDAEISQGEERWLAFADPFAGCFGAAHDDGVTDNTPQDATTDRSTGT